VADIKSESQDDGPEELERTVTVTHKKNSISTIDVALTAAKEAKAAKRMRLLIDPRTSKFIGYWDMTTALALLFTALVTPWEVAFAKAPTGAPVCQHCEGG